MSLLLGYHDRQRAAVCSDDRWTYFDESGMKRPGPSRVPKFIVLAGLIVGCVGRSDLTRQLLHGTARLVQAEKPEFSTLALALPPICRKLFAARKRVELSANDDRLHVQLLAYDGGRIRSYVWLSDDDFAAIDTTADSTNRITALGAFDVSAETALHDLTRRLAKPKALPFVASQLRDLVNEMNRKYPVVIGRASYFAALDRNGLVTLPPEFSLPSVVGEPELVLHGPGRFFVGSIRTPVATGPNTIGNSDGGSGAQYGTTTELQMTAAVVNGTGGSGLMGNGSVANIAAITDGDPTTFATLTVTANGAGNEAIVYISGPPAVKGNFSSLKLNILIGNDTNSGSPGPTELTIARSWQGPSGPWVTVLDYMSPTIIGTGGPQTLSFDVPSNVNLANVGVLISAVAYSSATSGQCIVKIYKVWLEGTE